MRNRIFPVVILLLSNLPLFSGELDEALDYLRDRQLEVSLATRIIESNDVTVWRMENTKLTMSGQAVNLKMSGEGLVIFAQITPYIRDDQTVLLVAKGEVFLSSQEEGTKYYSTLKSLPVSLGESVLFFPLGMAVDSERNLYYIELEILVQQHEDVADGEETEDSPEESVLPN